MTLSDLPQLRPLWQREGMDTNPQTFQQVLARNPETCFILEKEGQIVAAAMGLYDGRRGFVQSVVVREDLRGQGLGRKIVLRTVEALKTLGTDRIRLFVRKENAGVLGFYRRLGFEVEEGCYYLYEKSGTPV